MGAFLISMSTTVSALAGPGEDFVQRRNALRQRTSAPNQAPASSCSARPACGPHQAMAVGRAIERLVVDHRQRAIARQVDVQLDPVCAKLEPALERGKRVFGTVAHRAAMADHPDAPALLVQDAVGATGVQWVPESYYSMVAGSMQPPALWTFRPLLLRIWRDVPFPGWMRQVFLRILNPSFMVGAMALIQDEQGRMLLARAHLPPPGALGPAWRLAQAAPRVPKTGWCARCSKNRAARCGSTQLLAADFWGDSQLDLLFRCRSRAAAINRLTRRASTAGLAPTSCPSCCPISSPCSAKPGCSR